VADAPPAGVETLPLTLPEALGFEAPPDVPALTPPLAELLEFAGALELAEPPEEELPDVLAFSEEFSIEFDEVEGVSLDELLLELEPDVDDEPAGLSVDELLVEALELEGFSEVDDDEAVGVSDDLGSSSAA